MNSKAKSAGRKLLAMLLALMTILNLCMPALATSGEAGDASEDYGFLELKVYPYIGGLEPENRMKSQFPCDARKVFITCPNPKQ